ncbi:hypothetical protein B5F12_01090 [Pseudoflavonifractor sp. An176]|uniref:hypothetical protein n=1 Tax=Pseudoflavonifractor sp. An176 TaxID=1965572 RepID=UPI000B3AF535|nr:hypothetical protein [Pseudoflavonifractor sp. An176]OUP66145.1 hypothetical protein B5F12_01090 [Pseudoflavonifractor sp. An176]
MLIRTTRSQIGFLLRQKEAILTFCVLMLLMLANFVQNCQMFQGQDVIKLAHTTKMGLLSWNRASYSADLALLFQQIYPLLVVCPAGFVLAKERGTQEHILMITRMGSGMYYFSKLFSAFIVTAVVFIIPFLVEIPLHIIAFSTRPTWDLSHWGAYETQYIAEVRNYLFSGLYIRSPYGYAVVKIVLFGLFSGLMGAFSVAVSALYRVKFRITVLLPVFLLLNLSVYAPVILRNMEGLVAWNVILMLHEDAVKNVPVFLAVLVLVFLVSVGGTFWAARRDQL